MWLVPTVCWALFAMQADPQAAGLKALEEQKYDAAVEQFQKAVQAAPQEFSNYFHLGLAYSLLNRDELSIQNYREALKRKPGLYEAELNLGMVLLRQKRAAEALPLLQAAAEKKPQQFRPRYYAAEALLNTGKQAEAEAEFKTALTLDAKSAPAELGLAHALAARNQLAEAAPHFARAAELDPTYRDGLLELASLYEKAGKPEDAVALYRQFPDNVAAQERMGQLLAEQGRETDAIPVLEAAVQRSPTAANRLALANAYLRGKQHEKGLGLLQQVVEAEPANADLRLNYGRSLRDAKQYNAAAQQFYAVTKLRPNDKQAWSELSGMLILMENYPGALKALDQLEALGGGEIAGYHFFRALTLDHLKQPQPALLSYQKFLQLSEGKNPDQEFQARQRVRILQRELSKR